jgi:hypothetical protein
MSIFQKILDLFGEHKDKIQLPEQLGSLDELKTQAQDMIEQHADVLDQVADKIPGDADNAIIDKAKEMTGK